MKDKLYFEGKLYIAEEKLYFEVQRDKLYFGDKLYFKGQTLFSRTNFIRTSKWKRGPAVFVPFKMEDKMDVHDLPKETLEKYFYAGFEYKTIVLLLERHHSIKTSARTLRRVLSNLGLKRRGQSVDIDARSKESYEGRNGRARLFEGVQIDVASPSHQAPYTSAKNICCPSAARAGSRSIS